MLHTEYSQRTVGLVTLDELKKTKEELAKKEVILDELEREKEIKEELRKQAEASKKRKPKSQRPRCHLPRTLTATATGPRRKTN